MNEPSDPALEALLRRGIAKLSLTLRDDSVTSLLEYLALLRKWNRQFNLTAIREPRAMVTEHLLDALSVAHAIEGQRVIDVGTGAGLPGMVLAMLQPDRTFVLLDSNGKKTRFLREAVRVLSLGNVTIEQGRSEDYRPGAGFDTVVCRAFAPLPRLVALAGHLRAPTGIVLAQKGQLPTDEITELGDAWQVHSAVIHVPGLDKTRHLLTLRPTPTP